MALIAPGMRRRIVLQARTVTRDSYGAQVVTWADAATVWARRMPGAAPLQAASGAAPAVDSHARPVRYTIRPRALVKQDTRVVDAGRIMRVVDVVDDNRGQWLELSCQEWAHE